MEDLKLIIAQNLVELRKRKKYTQQDLANILGYSDKSISKWEKGDSLPDIEILTKICNLYNVTLDYLIHEGHYEEKKQYVVNTYERRNKIVIVGLITSLIWLIAIIILAYSMTFTNSKQPQWMACVWAVPATFIVLLVFNSLWGRKKWKYPIIAMLIWTTIASIYLQVLVITNQNVWPLFFIGIPLQIAVVLWSQIKH